jgi:hypothetical protein
MQLCNYKFKIIDNLLHFIFLFMLEISHTVTSESILYYKYRYKYKKFLIHIICL